MQSHEPLIKNIGELVAYIQAQHPDFNQLCQFLVTQTLAPLGAISIFGSSLDEAGYIRPFGQYGFTSEVMQSWGETHIDDDLPTADALRSQNIVWVADSEHWLDDHPDVAVHKIDDTAKTFIAWPISIGGAQMSILGLVLRESQAPSAPIISYLEALGGIVAMHLSRPHAESERKSNPLAFMTRRQREILELIAEGLTNPQIGRALDFSESTIRQETMRIYEILGARGRREAADLYRNLKAK